jgi:hypothetical protein
MYSPFLSKHTYLSEMLLLLVYISYKVGGTHRRYVEEQVNIRDFKAKEHEKLEKN